MPRIRAVIFDCYGTLVDILTDESKDEIFSQLSLYLRYYGANINGPTLKSLYHEEKERYLSTKGENFPEFDMAAIFKTILQMDGLGSPFMVESCCKLFRLISRERFQLYPDTLPALKELKSRGFPMVMVSNAQDIFFHAEIEMLGLKQYFSYFIVSSYWGFRKPDPRIFSLSCSLLNAPPSEAVYIGNDIVTDVAGAKSIGMGAVLIDREQKQKNREPRPDFYAANLQSVTEWIIKNS